MSDESSVSCANCKRDIPSINYEMHVAHCQRNIQLCPKCEEPVPRSELNEHDLEFHTQVKCPECRKTLESSSLGDHKTNDCPKRQKKCQFCELELKADTMDEHEDYCGSRTECCEICDKLVMLKYQDMHEDSGHRKTRPDEDSEESSYDDEDEGDYTRRSRDSARNDHLNRNAHRRASPREGMTGTHYPRRFDLDYDLDKSLQNMELDHARNTATVRPHIPHRVSPDHFVAQTDLIPCEFCEAPITFDELIQHQTGCRPELFSSPPSAGPQESTDDVLTRRNVAIRPRTREDDTSTLIPCEFCQKPFNLDFFTIHQAACQNRTAVPVSDLHYEDD